MMTVVTGSPCSAFFSAVYASRLEAAAAMLRRSARPRPASSWARLSLHRRPSLQKILRARQVQLLRLVVRGNGAEVISERLPPWG